MAYTKGNAFTNYSMPATRDEAPQSPMIPNDSVRTSLKKSPTRRPNVRLTSRVRLASMKAKRTSQSDGAGRIAFDVQSPGKPRYEFCFQQGQ